MLSKYISKTDKKTLSVESKQRLLEEFDDEWASGPILKRLMKA